MFVHFVACKSTTIVSDPNLLNRETFDVFIIINIFYW